MIHDVQGAVSWSHALRLCGLVRCAAEPHLMGLHVICCNYCHPMLHQLRLRIACVGADQTCCLLNEVQWPVLETGFSVMNCLKVSAMAGNILAIDL